MSTMPQHQIHQMESARVSIALNNAAVSLLENGQADQALAVFQRVATLPLLTPALRQEEVRRAAVLVAESQRDKQLGILEVYPIEDDDEPRKMDAFRYGPSSSIVFPLRLRDACSDAFAGGDSSVMSHTNYRNYVTACILYNFGLAYRCRFAATDRIISLVWADETLRAAKASLHTTVSGKPCTPKQLDESFRSDLLLALLCNAAERVLEERRMHEPGLAVADQELPVAMRPDQAYYASFVYHLRETCAAAA
jgi:hypothetical protein